VTTTIDGLADLVGRRVRVAARVLTVDGPIAALADDTGQTTLRFVSTGDASSVALRPAEVVNVIGWDSESDLGGVELVVTAAVDVTRGPILGDGSTGAGHTPGQASLSPDVTNPFTDDEPPIATDAANVSMGAGVIAGLAAAGLMLLAGAAAYIERGRRGASPRRPPGGPVAPVAAAGADAGITTPTAEHSLEPAAADDQNPAGDGGGLPRAQP
jgi:hypothetical protein